MLRKQLKKLGLEIRMENERAFLSLLEEDKEAKAMDMGCNDGGFTLRVGEKVGTRMISGIEIEEELSALARQKGIEVYRVDLNESLPINDGSYDVITAHQVLEHVKNTDLFIREICRLLKPGGYAIISTPNLATWHNIACIFLGYQLFATGISDEINIGNPLSPEYKQKTWGGIYDARYRVFTYKGLAELFQYHGFSVEKIIGVGYLPFPSKVAQLFSRLDPRHSMFLTVKARKPAVVKTIDNRI